MHQILSLSLSSGKNHSKSQSALLDWSLGKLWQTPTNGLNAHTLLVVRYLKHEPSPRSPPQKNQQPFLLLPFPRFSFLSPSTYSISTASCKLWCFGSGRHPRPTTSCVITEVSRTRARWGTVGPKLGQQLLSWDCDHHSQSLVREFSKGA